MINGLDRSHVKRQTVPQFVIEGEAFFDPR